MFQASGRADKKGSPPLDGTDELLEIARRRSPPGILVFDLKGKLCLASARALEMFPSLGDAARGASISAHDPPGRMLELCSRVISCAEGMAQPQQTAVLAASGEGIYIARAILAGSPSGGKGASHVFVLLETVVEKRTADWEKVRASYGLTAREVEVVRLVCDGFSNLSIGERLRISEQTVKDHLKNVLRKMGVFSRTEMMAVIL